MSRMHPSALHPDDDGPAASDDVAADDGRSESANERADRNWNEIIQELRAAQTGTQLISGFLLAVAFQSRFSELDHYQLGLYLTLVALAAAATLLGLAPVLVHRSHFRLREKERIVRLGNRFLIVDVGVIMVLTAGVCSLIFDFVLNRTAGIIAFVATGLASLAVVLLAGPRR